MNGNLFDDLLDTSGVEDANFLTPLLPSSPSIIGGIIGTLWGIFSKNKYDEKIKNNSNYRC